MPNMTSTPPTRPVAANPMVPRLKRRLPSTTLSSQIWSGSRPPIRRNYPDGSGSNGRVLGRGDGLACQRWTRPRSAYSWSARTGSEPRRRAGANLPCHRRASSSRSAARDAIGTLAAVDLVLPAPVAQRLLRDAETLRQLARGSALAQQFDSSRAGTVRGTSDAILSRRTARALACPRNRVRSSRSLRTRLGRHAPLASPALVANLAMRVVRRGKGSSLGDSAGLARSRSARSPSATEAHRAEARKLWAKNDAAGPAV